jgi:predicted patatin/cPLA2 family phospholipase
LVDDHHITQHIVALKAIAKFLDAAAISFGGKRSVQYVVHQRGFSRAANPSYHRERAQWEHYVDILQVVQGRSVQAQKSSGRFVPGRRNRDFHFTA